MKTVFENIKQVLALIVVISTYAIFFMVLLKYQTDNNAVSQVIIAVVGGFGTATGYYFGYSQGAAKKDETINTMSSNSNIENSETTLIVNKDEIKK